MEAPIELQPVKSSMFQSIGYNETNWVLCVVFKQSGLRLDYQQIPPELYDQLMSAESIGKFFTANIKGKFHAIGEEVASQAGDAPLPESEGGLTEEDLKYLPTGKPLAIPEEAFQVAQQVHEAAVAATGANPDFGVTEFDPHTGHRPNSEMNEDGTVKTEVLSAWEAPENPVQAIILLNDRTAEIDAIIKQNGEMARDAITIHVSDALSYASAGQVLQNLVNTKDRVFGLLDPIRSMLYKTYNTAGEKQKLALSALDGAIAYVKRCMVQFEGDQERIRQQQIRDAQVAAENAARAQQAQDSQQLTLAEVADALEAGDTARAEELVQNPIQAPMPYVAPVMPQAEILPPAGTGTRKNWKVNEETADLIKFLTAVKDGKVEVAKAAQYVKPDFAALNKLAKALETAFDVPGFHAFNDPVKTVRRGQ